MDDTKLDRLHAFNGSSAIRLELPTADQFAPESPQSAIIEEFLMRIDEIRGMPENPAQQAGVIRGVIGRLQHEWQRRDIEALLVGAGLRGPREIFSKEYLEIIDAHAKDVVSDAASNKKVAVRQPGEAALAHFWNSEPG